MKTVFFLILLFNLIHISHSQIFLGTFEVGDNIPLMNISADAQTGEATTPLNHSYNIYKMGSLIQSGAMNDVAVGIASATYDTAGNSPGYYHVLFSGLINGGTTYTLQSYSLVSEGNGPDNMGNEVAGLNGLTPLTTSSFQPFQTETLETIGSKTESVTASINVLQSDVTSLIGETKTGTREFSRSRLWYAQNTIDFATRKVPADLPSHLEVQLAAPDDVLFASPIETFFKIFYYPDASASTKASREVRSSTPPQDGTFYLQPDIGWDE